MLSVRPIDFEFYVSILDYKFIALVLKVLKLTSVIFLSLKEVFQFLLQSDFHLDSSLTLE